MKDPAGGASVVDVLQDLGKGQGAKMRRELEGSYQDMLERLGRLEL
jgi:hypothetical protein